MIRYLTLLPLLLVLLAACASQDSEVLRENRQLREEVTRLRKELAAARGGKSVKLARTLGGKVARVEGSQVAITLGGDAGVKVDDIFHLRRGSDYVGRVTVTRVSKGEAVGEFDGKYPGPGAPPQVGDVVYLAHG